MILVLCLAYLAVTAHSSCSQADSFECSSSLCGSYRWTNGACALDPASTCVRGAEVA